MSEERSFKGIWIPKEIWLNRQLNIYEKVLIVEIDSLDNKNGCFAKNNHFMNLINKSERQVQRLIKNLVDKEYIKVKLIYKNGSKEIESRILKTNKNKFYDMFCNAGECSDSTTKLSQGGDKNGALGGDKNGVVNNTYNNTYINIYSRVIEHLNKKANMRYKHTTKKTQQLIKARIDEGFTVEDFEKVIDTKEAEWRNTEFARYLRPETLFGTKFESYLNQRGSISNDRNQGRISRGSKASFEGHKLKENDEYRLTEEERTRAEAELD